ncbi:MAG: type IV toxin-antitoxin system AbiEi family antitoxin domain-containing protein, partial [Chloroflexi bacterium]|nr:type IV toxin-antitoxin system AbiEi family antitoxin domain-containing protein [Chloroflexota bacterium]
MKHLTEQNRNNIDRAKAVFRQHGGTLQTMKSIRLGIHPRTLYAMRDAGVLTQLGRGLYRLAEAPPLANHDLVSVALNVPQGVICLVSALSFHELTTQVPHEVYVALQRGAAAPRIPHPPIRIFWFGGGAFSEGTETHSVDGVYVHVYSPEKTLADCFKYRNKIG